MLAFVFPGQGSQKRGMGGALFSQVPEYTAVEREVDRLVGYSMRGLCLEDPQNLLRETQYTQPALYVVNALHYFKAKAEGESPAFLAGHSLGEYNALLAGGVFDFVTGLKLVQKRGEIMATVKNGGMAAVIGLSGERVAEILGAGELSGLDVANFNSPSQTVISGASALIKRAEGVFEAAGARMCIPLEVSAAFHSRHMAAAAESFSSFLAPVTCNAPRVPVIANTTSRPYPANSADIKALLVQQISRPVLWTQSIRYLLQHGVKTCKEIGPGTVLTRLLQQIQATSA